MQTVGFLPNIERMPHGTVPANSLDQSGYSPRSKDIDPHFGHETNAMGLEIACCGATLLLRGLGCAQCDKAVAECHAAMVGPPPTIFAHFTTLQAGQVNANTNERVLSVKSVTSRYARQLPRSHLPRDAKESGPHSERPSRKPHRTGCRDLSH